MIKQGDVSCIDDKGEVKSTKSIGEFFGEFSIFTESNYSLNVLSSTECTCLSISIEILMNVLGNECKDILLRSFIKDSFKHSTYFSDVSPQLIDRIYPKFKLKSYADGQIVIRKDYLATQRVIIIIEGTLVKSSNTEIKIASKGDILFESNVFHDIREKTVENILAQHDCVIMHINVSDLTLTLGGSIKEIILKSEIMNSLEKKQLFKNFSRSHLESIASEIEIKTYKVGEIIFKEGDEGKELYLIKSGIVDLYKKGEFKSSVISNEIFGERVFLLKEPRYATAKSQTDVICYSLKKSSISPYLEESFKRNLLSRYYLEDTSFELKDLDFIRLIRNSTNKICLVESKVTKQKYTVKCTLKNNRLDSQNRMQSNLDKEIKVLSMVDHPFIAKLIKSFEDKNYVYLIMEHIVGKDLIDVIEETGPLKQDMVQLYLASLLVAANYLHQINCIHRNIKPENLMIAENGYAKLIDFGCSKLIEDHTYTVIGTPHYMAPEMINGEGYSFIVDYWSIGICLYELIFGELPFGNEMEDSLSVFLCISNQ